MSKVLRRLMAQELQKSLENIDSFILVTYDKLNSEDTYIFRSTLREHKMAMKVVKNSLAEIVYKNLYNANLKDELTGQVAMIYGGDSPVDIAKFLTDWVKKNANTPIKIKGGCLSGQVLPMEQIEELAKVPSREVILSLLAGAFESPLKQVPVLVNSAMQNISNALENLIEKQAS